MKRISILVPVYNEEKVLDMFYNRTTSVINKITNYDFEILFVLDGSNDKSLDLIRDFRNRDNRINYIDLARNFGKEIAMIAGFDYVTGDAAIIMDADLQDPPELIPELIKYWEEGYDDVYARRRSRKGETLLKKFTANMYYKILQKFTRVPIQKDTGDFRLLDRRCINVLKKIRETNRCSKSIFSWIGYKKKEVLFDRDARAAGKTKWNYRKLVDLAIDGITSFTTSPLRIAVYLSVLTFLGLFVFLTCCIINWLSGGQYLVSQAIISLILFFSAVQMMLIGIVGEYLGRIFNESKRRPLYLVNEYNGIRELNQ
jgi:glycosyltransferase involved in cell wall biosynthesis